MSLPLVCIHMKTDNAKTEKQVATQLLRVSPRHTGLMVTASFERDAYCQGG